ncbi:MAG: hypothetical protein ABW128_16990 [Rhizorhabdus sp.]
MLDTPTFVTKLKAIKQSLEHARRFKLHPKDHLSALVQAEGDVEELLIDYGFLSSEDRDPDRKVHVHVDHEVQAGSGCNGNFRNRTYAQAKEIYDRESRALSYHRAYPGQKQSAALMRITTITETLS